MNVSCPYVSRSLHCNVEKCKTNVVLEKLNNAQISVNSNRPSEYEIFKRLEDFTNSLFLVVLL